ncbi:hypothetical protein Poly51_47200 [Rubripirellula tenax]|uniref:Uncharacterized protein n=1 Tax=Rubripirellula tenax TaxID=2528015 RepID=A0A5C6EMN6_9BACT|nr:hypothetical protein [Rubripirellula tenax]TWU48816.1 hypothetical protein Poly51_47200 [Rubripirellula tenax]
MNESLLHRMRPVTRRLRLMRFWQVWAVFAVVAVAVAWWLKSRAGSGVIDGYGAALTLASIAFGCAVAVAIGCALMYRDPRMVARRIEEKFPALDQRLLTALSQRDDQLGFLQQRVVREARDHSRSNAWIDAVSAKQFWLSRLSGLAATALLVAGIVSLSVTTPKAQGRALPAIDPGAEPVVLPGNVEIEKGTSFVVTTRFAGGGVDRGELIVEDASGTERTLPMTQSLDDPVLAAFVASVQDPLQYRVTARSWSSESYRVDVFEYPEMKRADASLEYPSYTSLVPKRIENTVRVSAVVGTQLTWQIMLNKPVVTAVLVDEDGLRLPLAFANPEASVGEVALLVQQSQRFTLELVDDAGRKNKYPPTLVVRALANEPPKLKVTPAKDSEVSALEEFPLLLNVVDDFGVSEVGLVYSLSGGQPTEITLRRDIQRGEKVTLEQMLALEDLNAQPDQLLAYHFFATDVDADGNARRTDSDMYFAEVRPFDQIFRQGDPPPSGPPSPPSPSAAQADELAELQKEIISATWRVIRDQRSLGKNDTFNTSVDLLAESQQEALAKLEELASELSDPRSQAFVDAVRSSMTSAAEAIEASRADAKGGKLSKAVPHEQAAYGGLLKLRAREFEVAKAQQKPSQGQSSAAQKKRQQQLDDLELEQDENRYETQSQAEPSSQEEAAQQEVRQLLSMLRDLARRQEDLNEELAQLQSALEQAETEEERKAIERQLQRLRDQQEDLLRETDELAERMNDSSNEASNADAQEQLQDTRQDVQEAAKALEEKDVATALASGKRAERQFEDMRDDFRKEAAGQFNDAMRQMRSEAQTLDEKQQELVEKLADVPSADESPGLRPEESRPDVESEMEEQREAIDDLLNQMQETVAEAEEAEPLLAQKLYDSYRSTRQRGVDQAMSQAVELTRRGMKLEAEEVIEKASEGVSQLRKDLEDAAESVLGDESKALERALGELDRLDEQLTREIDQNQSSNEPQSEADSGATPGQGSTSEEDAKDPGNSEAGQPSQGSRRPQQQGSGKGESPAESESEGSPESSGLPSSQASPEQRDAGGKRSASAQQSEGGGPMQAFERGGPNAAPLTGEGFREWSDSLREVEEMVDDPELRSQAARIRDRARQIRIDFKRHSKEPEWNLVEEMIATPLRELKRNVSEEFVRRSAERNAAVPIDRDPVPPQFDNAVRQYYERLGSGQ